MCLCIRVGVDAHIPKVAVQVTEFNFFSSPFTSLGQEKVKGREKRTRMG